ncbi:MAG: cytochrome c biogenesis heme-transporting ATPase CcmA [Woeseiaceae bacterium]
MTELLSGNDLCLFRGDRCLFKSIGFALNQGELLVIEGPNGSGKTSLLRGIAGLLEFEQGDIMWTGHLASSQHQAFRADVVWLSHKIGFKGDLNLVENLRLEASLRETHEDRLPQVLERLDLVALTELPVRSLSAGQQRRIALARMLLAKARIWMMDEPFTNLDKAGQALVSELLAEHLEADGACIVASHQPLNIDGRTNRISLA